MRLRLPLSRGLSSRRHRPPSTWQEFFRDAAAARPHPIGPAGAARGRLSRARLRRCVFHTGAPTTRTMTGPSPGAARGRPTDGGFSATETAILSAAYGHVPAEGFSRRALALAPATPATPDASIGALPDDVFGLVRWHLFTRREALARSRHDTPRRRCRRRRDRRQQGAPADVGAAAGEPRYHNTMARGVCSCGGPRKTKPSRLSFSRAKSEEDIKETRPFADPWLCVFCCL